MKHIFGAACLWNRKTQSRQRRLSGLSELKELVFLGQVATNKTMEKILASLDSLTQRVVHVEGGIDELKRTNSEEHRWDMRIAASDQSLSKPNAIEVDCVAKRRDWKE